MKFLKKLKIELPYNAATPLLGLYPDKTKCQKKKKICTMMFTAALCAISNTWKQSKCHIKRRMNKEAVVQIYEGILLSHKKNEMSFAVTWMDVEIIILRIVSQTEKDKYHMISLINGI